MSKINVESRTSLAMLLCSLAVSAGCGGSGLSLGQVSGKVTLDGKPLTEGTVTFLPEKGPAAAGALDAKGRYELTTQSPGDGAVVGKHRVTVAPPTTGVVLEPGKPPTAPPANQTGPEIPAKFQNVATSGLSAEVSSGSNEFNFDL